MQERLYEGSSAKVSEWVVSIDTESPLTQGTVAEAAEFWQFNPKTLKGKAELNQAAKRDLIWHKPSLRHRVGAAAAGGTLGARDELG